MLKYFIYNIFCSLLIRTIHWRQSKTRTASKYYSVSLHFIIFYTYKHLTILEGSDELFFSIFSSRKSHRIKFQYFIDINMFIVFKYFRVSIVCLAFIISCIAFHCITILCEAPFRIVGYLIRN